MCNVRYCTMQRYGVGIPDCITRTSRATEQSAGPCLAIVYEYLPTRRRATFELGHTTDEESSFTYRFTRAPSTPHAAPESQRANEQPVHGISTMEASNRKFISWCRCVTRHDRSLRMS